MRQSTPSSNRSSPNDIEELPDLDAKPETKPEKEKESDRESLTEKKVEPVKTASPSVPVKLQIDNTGI